MSQHTNKWGWQGYNCKMRPAGSGTTHSTRREQRKALQWDQLAANHQPDTEDSLEKQLEALEKAAQKAKEKMEELKEKKRKEEEEEEEESYSYYYSPTPPKKLPKKGKDKAKPGAKSLEKDRPRSVSVRRTRVAKYGQKEQLLEVKEEEEEGGGQASSSKPPGNKPPGKWVLAEALEKASVPEEGNKEHGKKDQALEKAPVVAEEGKKQEALEKATAVVPEQGITLTSAAPAASSVVPDGITLTPAPSTNKAALEKVTLKPAPGRRPVVVVDWHNSLEKEDTVPESHQEALEQLMQVADVHILSYVGTRNRMAQVHQDVKDMVRAMAQLAGVHTCWHKTGWQGKAAYCIWLKASAIFDDDEKICTECFGKGIETYALMSGSSSHNYLPSRRVFKDFPEAVAEYIDGLT